MNPFVQLFAALAGSFGFAALFNLHGRKLAFASLGGLLSWGVYLIAERLAPNPYICALASSSALTVYAEMMARIHKSPATIFLVSASIPLVPGAALYRSVNYLMHRQTELCYAESLYTLLFAASMSAGITLTTLLIRVLFPRHKSAKQGH